MIYLYDKTSSTIITSHQYEYVDTKAYEEKYNAFRDDIENGYKVILFNAKDNELYVTDVPAYAVITDDYGNLYLADKEPTLNDNIVNVIKINKKDKAKMMADINEGYEYWLENGEFKKIKVGENEKYDSATHKVSPIDLTADRIRTIKHRLLSNDYRNLISSRGIEFTYNDHTYYIPFTNYTETSLRLLTVMSLGDGNRELLAQSVRADGVFIPVVLHDVSYDLINSITVKLNAFDIYLDSAIKDFTQNITDDNDLNSLIEKETKATDIIYNSVLTKYANKDMVEKEV